METRSKATRDLALSVDVNPSAESPARMGEGTPMSDVDVEQNFVEMGDIELPDDDPVQCGSEFCVICNELATEQR